MLAKNSIRNTVVTLLAASALTFSACSKHDSAGSADKKYSGPGSKWDVNLRADGTFTIDKYASVSSTSADFSVTGTHTALSTGFKKLTVGSVTGSGGPTAGDIAYGLEVPGYVFVLKPMSGDQIIPMVIAGSCPTADMDANWVMVNIPASATLASTDIAGTFHYNNSTSTPSLPAKYDISGNSLGSGTITAGTCSSGIMSVSDAVMYLTNSGGAIVHTGVTNPTESSFIFAFKQRAISDIASLNGNYAGLVFNESAASGSQVNPVKLTCTSGVCTANQLSNVETGATTGSAVTVTFSTPDSPSSGLVRATVTSGGTGNVMCMVDKNAAETGKIIISCAGQDPGDTTKMFNVLFTSI